MDLCGILPYKRMCPHLCGRIIYCISSPFFILQSIRSGPNIVCNDQLNRARVIIFFRIDVGHFNFSMKMQASFKHGSCFGEFGCKTPQQLFSLSNTVDATKDHVNRIGEAE